MKVGFTPDEVQAMYARARVEVAEVFNQPYLLDLPLEVEDFGMGADAIAVTKYPENGAVGSLAEVIGFNERYLPYLYEDEVRYGLLHELAHASLGWKGFGEDDEEDPGHGPDWEQRIEALGYPQAWYWPRLSSEVPTLSNLLAGILGEQPQDPAPEQTLGPVFE